MMKIDLHIHSNCSDGSDNIVELAKNIKNAGIEVFALTDHDTVEGCQKMQEIISDKIKFIQGVELTCICDDIKCHILGYGIDTKNSELVALIEKGKRLRRQKLETRINYLKNMWNIELNKKELDWLYSRKSVVKTHLANILVNRGLANNNISAMKKYLDDCKTGNTRFNGQEAIKAIKSAGGVVIWAHPIGGEGETHLTEKEFLPKLKKMIDFGIEGLECYYSRYNQSETNFLIANAQKFGLKISAGSDYHGSNKDIPLGNLKADCRLCNINI